ncbi:MAG TPA: VOC family protein, partial [Candidatus Limnocylindria bacterium]|nr:VOC family protein [Candidatus Limnocylindria bacterium]
MARIDLVYLYVTDLERACAFYRDLLGVPLEIDAEDAHWAEARLPGGIRFALHLAGEAAPPQVPGTVRVNFEVDDVEREADRLRGAGVRIGETLHEPWGSMVEVFDPDGYAIELFAR